MLCELLSLEMLAPNPPAAVTALEAGAGGGAGGSPGPPPHVAAGPLGSQLPSTWGSTQQHAERPDERHRCDLKHSPTE